MFLQRPFKGSVGKVVVQSGRRHTLASIKGGSTTRSWADAGRRIIIEVVIRIKAIMQRVTRRTTSVVANTIADGMITIRTRLMVWSIAIGIWVW